MTDLEFIKQCMGTDPLKFYKSTKWKHLRLEVLAMDHHECVKCKTEKNVITQANTVHHVNDIKKHPELGLSIWYTDKNGERKRNLISLCSKCHDEIHGYRGVMYPGRQWTHTGPNRVVIVTGPPASGKNTYVRNHKKRSDMVIDFDAINSAITMNEKSARLGKLWDVANGVKEYLYHRIDQHNIGCDTVWVIGCFPNALSLVKLRERFNAEVITMDVSKKECIARAMQDAERTDKSKQVDIINRWFDVHQTHSVATIERWD